MYPSQKRYQERKPTISFRLSKEYKEKLREIAKKEEISLSKWVENFIKGRIEEKEEIIKLKEEIEKLKKENKEIIRFKTPCCRCGKDIIFTPSLPNWDSKIYPILKKAFADWRHRECSY